MSPYSKAGGLGGNQEFTLTDQIIKNNKTIHNDHQKVPMDDYLKLVRENAELKDKEMKYIETIRHLKNQNDVEKKQMRSLRAEKVNFMAQRNELEEFFLQCIEEVRKDIIKRKSITQQSKIGGGNTKSMKKSTSSHSIGIKSTDDYQAKLDHYTATDKRKVIELLMSNENVLLFLYEKLFPATSVSTQSTQSRQPTGFSGNLLNGMIGGSQARGIPDSLSNQL